ncbi:MAG TPA: peptidase S24 [Candidatus Cryptobacteroides pullicola]|nr:peptidase S24 [Candidatus Cryptobacteroides pullicola]
MADVDDLKQFRPVIDLNAELVRHPEATFYGRVSGNSLSDAGLHDGDVLVIDKSLEPSDGSLVVCFADGEFRAGYMSVRRGGVWLVPAAGDRGAVRLDGEGRVPVWGVVTYVIKKVR